jgi:hypothetical protein
MLYYSISSLGTVLDTGMHKLTFPLFKLYFVGGWIRTMGSLLYGSSYKLYAGECAAVCCS